MADQVRAMQSIGRRRQDTRSSQHKPPFFSEWPNARTVRGNTNQEDMGEAEPKVPVKTRTHTRDKSQEGTKDRTRLLVYSRYCSNKKLVAKSTLVEELAKLG